MKVPIDTNEIEIRILEILGESPMGTLQISKLVMGKDGTQKMVNPSLYRLLKEGSIRQNKEGNVITWFK